MDKMFVRCMGKTACQENADGCRTCGRSLEEIYGTRALVDELAKFAQRMGYRNPEVFFQYVADKAGKKVAYMQQQQAGTIAQKAAV